MAKAAQAPAATEPTKSEAPAAVGPKVTLVEFCSRLSETVKRPELIGAFESTERRKKRTKATEAEFRADWEKFIKTPV